MPCCPQSLLAEERIIQLHEAAANEPFFSAQISLSMNMGLFSTGQARKHISARFSCTDDYTAMEWHNHLPKDLKGQLQKKERQNIPTG